jgi:hypothetical protein
MMIDDVFLKKKDSNQLSQGTNIFSENASLKGSISVAGAISQDLNDRHFFRGGYSPAIHAPSSSSKRVKMLPEVAVDSI